MEAILVTVSVLSTLLVVGIIVGIVIVFNNLKGKVDVAAYINDQQDRERKDIDFLHDLSNDNRDLINRIDNIEKELWDAHHINQEKIDRELEDIKRLIDSRCDKLYDNLHTLKGNNKELLTD